MRATEALDVKSKLFVFIVLPISLLALYACNGGGARRAGTAGVSVAVDICDAGKLRAVTMEYTGDGCDVTSHGQETEKVSCSGDPMDEMMVRIVATDKQDLSDPKAKVWFDDVVELNDEFEIDAVNAGEDGLKSSTYVTIFNMNGDVLQTANFHTSCSQPLRLGDQFGSLSLSGSTPKN